MIRPFLVFNGEYEDEKMNRIGVLNTYELMEETLFENNFLHFHRDKSEIIKNGIRSEVLKKLRSFASNINPETELLLFYFCGHGCPDYSSKKLYLAMKDTDFNYVTDNSIAADKINEIIADNHIRYYAIVLDCCHSGMHSLGSEEKINYTISLGSYSESKGAFFIPTIEPSQIVQTEEINGKMYAPFSFFFFKTLQEGIANEFKRLSLKEIYSQVKSNLKKYNYNLPVVEQKGELFNVQIWENLRYRDVENEYIPEKTASTLNVLLVKSAIYHPIKYDDFGIPLGLWVLKDYIEKYSMDIHIEIYDERLELQKVQDEPISKKQVLNQFSNIIKNYDVIGISMSSSEVCPALLKLKTAKEQGKITIAGGIFTSSNEKYLLETRVVDYVTPGIGTSSLRKLLEWLLKQKRIKLTKGNEKNEHHIELNNELSGVATIDNLHSFFVPTDIGLSNMSFETWRIIIDKYKPFLFDETINEYKIDIFSARGCNGTCSFCSVQKECGRQISYRSEISVINEIKNLYNNGFRYFSLKDEDCLSNENHLMKILKSVQLPDIKFKIRTRIDHLLDKNQLLQELSQLGVIEIQYGIESSDYMLLNTIHKGIKKKQIDNIKSLINQHAELNIIANCSFILGLSGETEEYYDDLFSFIKEIYDYSDNCKPKIYINFFTPHPIASSFQVERNFKMITTDLNYFTHKYPIGFYEQESGFAIREKMIDTYEKIIDYTNSTKFNPSLRNGTKYEHLDAFLWGNKYIIKNPQLPDYCGR